MANARGVFRQAGIDLDEGQRHIRPDMARIVRTHYRYQRPPGKRKAVALRGPVAGQDAPHRQFLYASRKAP
jgi:hypothetical protein